MQTGRSGDDFGRVGDGHDVFRSNTDKGAINGGDADDQSMEQLLDPNNPSLTEINAL